MAAAAAGDNNQRLAQPFIYLATPGRKNAPGFFVEVENDEGMALSTGSGQASLPATTDAEVVMGRPASHVF